MERFKAQPYPLEAQQISNDWLPNVFQCQGGSKIDNILVLALSALHVCKSPHIVSMYSQILYKSDTREMFCQMGFNTF